jgi:hypothetical protein
MDTEQIKHLYNEFLLTYNTTEKDDIWKVQSGLFRKFWQERILAKEIKELNDQEIDEIIRLLDRSGKGNTKNSEAIARVMIAQGAWRRLMNQIHAESTLSSIITDIFSEKDLNKQAANIDSLYKLNEANKNNLTGQSGNGICSLLALYDPFANLSLISQKDRRKLIEYFNIKALETFDTLSIGQKIVQTNQLIMDWFGSMGINSSARTISMFCYSQPMMGLWREEKEEIQAPLEEAETALPLEDNIHNKFLFYMESQLEDFLIENWDKTELGHKYDLIVEDGELVSQQYPTDIGRIDILAKDKESNRLVVIELKRNQTSDDTVGQLTRYMGWIEEKKTNGVPTIGIIIAGKYDERLYYAMKKVQDCEVYLYKVDFKLEQYKKA